MAYTQEQLAAALRKADAAGDTEAARAIAQRLQSMRAPSKTMEELTPGISTDPAEGRGNFMAGVGKSLRDTGLGLVQSAASGGNIGGNIRSMAGGLGIDMPQGPIADWADERIAANQEADKALTDTRSGFVGNVAGVVGQLVGPGGALKLASRVPSLSAQAPALSAAGSGFLPTTVPGGVVQGAALGSVQPVAEGQSREQNAAIGAGGGFVGGMLPRVAGAGVRTVNRLIEPLTNSGLERIAGRTLQRFAASPRLNILADPITGSAPTLAEATLDPGIAQLQRASLSKSPAVANAVHQARANANEARANALQRFAGDPAKRQAALDAIDKAEDAAYSSMDDIGGVEVAPIVSRLDKVLAGPEGKRPAVQATLKKVRGLFFEPYEDSARIKDARSIVNDALGGRMSSADDAALREARRLLSNRAEASADEVVEALSGLKATSKKAQSALDDARELVNSLNVAYENEVPRLIGARKAINDMLSGKGDSREGALAQAQLISIRAQLDDAIRKVAPQIDTALDARRVGMRPVNEMDTMTQLLQDATVPVPTPAGGITRALQPSRLLNPTDDLDKLARKGTGFSRAEAENVLSPEAQNAIQGVRVGLARQQFADNAAKVPGSPTAQFLAGQNIMDGILGQPGGITSGLRNIGAAALDKPYAFVGVPERLDAVMAEILTNPQSAQRILSRLPAPDRALLEQSIGRLSAPAGVGVASGNNR
jgi:hypothetical protein